MDAVAQRYNFGTGQALRGFMRRNKVIISGSTALLAFHFGLFQARDLDLYAPITSKSAIEAFLKEKGYLMHFRPTQNPYGEESGTVIRVDKYASARKSIDVVYTKGNPIQAVAEFHSTLVMNYISWYGAVSFYPALTLAGKGIMNANSTSANDCREKYESKGFQFTCRLLEKHDCRRYFACPSTVRSIHDSSIMHVPFASVSSTLAMLEDNLVWRLNNNTCGETTRGFAISNIGEISKYSPLN